MLNLRYTHGLGPAQVQEIRKAVQDEAAGKGLAAQQGFVLLFVVDELVCNVMEHARAAWMELRIEADQKGFRCALTDDGVPFDTAHHARSASTKDLKGEQERRVGLNLVGRLVDDVKYHRTPEGLNLVELAKHW